MFPDYVHCFFYLQLRSLVLLTSLFWKWVFNAENFSQFSMFTSLKFILCCTFVSFGPDFLLFCLWRHNKLHVSLQSCAHAFSWKGVFIPGCLTLNPSCNIIYASRNSNSSLNLYCIFRVPLSTYHSWQEQSRYICDSIFFFFQKMCSGHSRYSRSSFLCHTCICKFQHQRTFPARMRGAQYL